MTRLCAKLGSLHADLTPPSSHGLTICWCWQSINQSALIWFIPESAQTPYFTTHHIWSVTPFYILLGHLDLVKFLPFVNYSTRFTNSCFIFEHTSSIEHASYCWFSKCNIWPCKGQKGRSQIITNIFRKIKCLKIRV